MATPINVLPEELLRLIFLFLAIADPPQRITGINYTEYYDLGWIKSTHVCRPWRHIALDASVLWSDITFVLGTTWARQMIARAKSSPLTIAWDSRHLFAKDLVSTTISEHASQVQRLHFDCNNKCRLIQDVVDSFDKPTPLLQEFRLTSRSGYCGHLIELPLHFLTETPNLRILELQYCFVPWARTSLFRGLSVLKITLAIDSVSSVSALSGSPAGSTQPMIAEFLAILQECPSLHTLEVDGALPAFKSHTVAPRPRSIQLLRLKSLRLGGDASDIMELCHSLAMPPSVELALDCRINHSLTEARKSFSEIISEHLKAFIPLCPSITTLYLRTSPSDIYIAFFPESWTHGGEQRHRFMFRASTRYWGTIAIAGTEVFQHILFTVDLSTIRSLFLNNTPSIQDLSAMFRRLLDAMPNLEELAVSYRMVALLPSALAGYTFQCGAWTTTVTPKLRYIRLHCVRYEPGVDEETWCANFREVLTTRTDRGAVRVDKLCIVDCDIGDETVRSLREVVAEVEWEKRIKEWKI